MTDPEDLLVSCEMICLCPLPISTRHSVDYSSSPRTLIQAERCTARSLPMAAAGSTANSLAALLSIGPAVDGYKIHESEGDLHQEEEEEEGTPAPN